jgi:hypothetical protein
MEDFIAAHAKPGAPPPVVSAAPAWMSDFVAPAAGASSTDAAKPGEPEDKPARPGWMKDFDS